MKEGRRKKGENSKAKQNNSTLLEQVLLFRCVIRLVYKEILPLKRSFCSWLSRCVPLGGGTWYSGDLWGLSGQRKRGTACRHLYFGFQGKKWQIRVQGLGLPGLNDFRGLWGTGLVPHLVSSLGEGL